jgi:uncharacterized membrane protein
MSGSVILARALHVLGVIIWIGGVAFVTAVLIPACGALSVDGPAQFERLERRFAWIARAMVLLVGVTGFYMMEQLDLWAMFSQARFWWLHAMVGVWTVFVIILFIAEPLSHKQFADRLRRDPVGTFRIMRIMHWTLLGASLVAAAGAVAGAHGYAIFE